MTCVLHKYMGFFPGKLLLLKVNIESGRVRVLKALKQSVPQDLAQKLSSSFQLQKCSTCGRNESLLRGLKRFSPSFPAFFLCFSLHFSKGPVFSGGAALRGRPGTLRELLALTPGFVRSQMSEQFRLELQTPDHFKPDLIKLNPFKLN